jgi:uncharacterized protein (TIGR03086 family)
MTDLSRYDRAAAVAAGIIAAVKPDQLDGPTPCADWTVRQVINHLVTGNLLFANIVRGTPPPDRGQDHLGDDPMRAFRDGVADLRAAFSRCREIARHCSPTYLPGRSSSGC